MLPVIVTEGTFVAVPIVHALHTRPQGVAYAVVTIVVLQTFGAATLLIAATHTTVVVSRTTATHTILAARGKALVVFLAFYTRTLVTIRGGTAAIRVIAALCTTTGCTNRGVLTTIGILITADATTTGLTARRGLGAFVVHLTSDAAMTTAANRCVT